jgi:hypothetical protein
MADEDAFVNFDEQPEEGAEPSAKKRIVATTSEKESDLVNVWSINKVVLYKPDRTKVARGRTFFFFFFFFFFFSHLLSFSSTRLSNSSQKTAIPLK